MKQLVIILLVALCGVANAQKWEYGKTNEKGNFTEYVTKNGDLIAIGDSLILGKASSDLGFQCITQNGMAMHPSHSGKVVVVSSMKAFGNNQQGYKLFLQFKGYGLLPVNIDYEAAIDANEIRNPKAKPTKAMAIKKLKDAKELLDLQLMSQTDYDKLKNELSPIITRNE